MLNQVAEHARSSMCSASTESGYLSLNGLYAAKTFRRRTPQVILQPSTIKIEVTLNTLSTLLTSYMYRMHVLLPIVDTLQASKLVSELGGECSNNAKTSIYIPSTIGSVIALQILALGELCHTESQADASLAIDLSLPEGQPESGLGRTCHAYAVDILKHIVKHNCLEYLQATLLVAVYELQLGNLLESWNWITNAFKVLPTVSDDPGRHSLVPSICWYLQQ